MEKEEKIKAQTTSKQRLIISLFALTIILTIGLVYQKYSSRSKPQLAPPNWDPDYTSPKVFTKEELKERYDGRAGRPAYLVILGEVYDVMGSEHYKEGSGYHVFIGQDASTAFVTGKFNDGVPSDDVSQLESHQMRGIEDWIKFYRNHEKYKFVGVMQGRYYNSQGKRTSQWRNAKEKMDSAKEDAVKAELESKKFPSCNTKWTQNEGTTIWCEDSMIKDRQLTSPLVPRKLELEETMKCVCVEFDVAQKDESFKAYPKCEGKQQSCFFK